jgi:thiol-disulfide isomerase/thioredoxin
MTKLLLALTSMLSACGGIVWAQCEIPAEIREILKKPGIQRTKILETQQERSARVAAIKEALTAYPDNYFLLQTQLRGFDDPNERLRRAKEMRKQHPDNPVYAVLEADALLGIDTAAAIRLLEEQKAAHPEMQLNLAVANAVSNGKLWDKAKAQKELDGYINACADSISLDGLFLSLILQVGTPEQVAWTTAAVRKRLESDPKEDRTAPWEMLWKMEFKEHPAAEHSAVRKRIAEDLAKLEKSPRRQEVAFIKFLSGGYENLGDQAAVERLDEDILKLHRQSTEARQIVWNRWIDKHPFPAKGDEATREQYYRSALPMLREWQKIWPDDSWILHRIFWTLSGLPETSAKQIAGAVDSFLAAYRKDASWSANPPLEFMIAEQYVKHRIRLDQVPTLIKQSYSAQKRFYELNLNDDRSDEQARMMAQKSMDFLHVEAAHILLDCYAVTKQLHKAKEVLAEFASSDTSKAPMSHEVLSLRAQVSEMEGRKLDALMMYRSALEARGQFTQSSGERDKLSENVQRLWKEMGGTQEGLGLPAAKRKPAESSEGHWERSKSSLPSFSLKDLNGKNWDLTKLAGKTLLINVWATWCGPCIAEHPEFQKIYEKLKARSDIAVLSFNIDEDIGKVSPYITKHHYTFPVILAADLVNEFKPSLVIPQNWLVNRAGKLAWEQMGYNASDKNWQEEILTKLEEMAKK